MPKFSSFFGVVSVKDFGAAGNNTGNDATAFANAAAALIDGGVVEIPAGTYRFTAMLDQPEGVTFRGVGSADVTINVVGAITGWRYKPASGVTSIQDTLSGLTIAGTSSGVAGLQISDCFGYRVQDVVVQDFTTGVGILHHNVTAWTEHIVLDSVHVSNCAIGVRYKRTSGSGGTDSVGYHRWYGLAINVPASGIGVDVGESAALNLYNSNLTFVAWLSTGGTGIRVQAGSTISGNLCIDGEKESGATGTTGLNNLGSITGIGRLDIDGDAQVWGDFRLELRDPTPVVAERFVDDFVGTTPDLRKWLVSGDVAISGGRARLQATTTYAYDLRSTILVNLTASSVAAQIEVAPTGSDGSVETFFELVDFFSDSSLSFIKSDTSLTLRNRTNGSNSNTSITYSATDHAWWRLIEAGGSVNFDTSPDGRSWTTRRTVTPSWNYQNLQVTAQSAYWGSPGAGPFYAYLDNVNLTPGVDTYPAILATAAVAGFAYLPTCAGTPTGTPTVATANGLPAVYDTTNHRLYVYEAGAWHYLARDA